MTKILLAVTNDVYTDQRVHKIATTLSGLKADVTVIGRKLRPNYPTQKTKYKIKRLRLLFRKKAIFYAEFNIRLFLYLLFKKATIIIANDLDTLLACYMASRIKSCTIVYDAHEYFTEVPELVNRPKTKKFWEFLERKLVPKINYAYTVCDSLARIYNEKYGTTMKVIRNVPYKNKVRKRANAPKLKREGQKLILYQGSVNIGRGLENMILAMHYLKGFSLAIIGDGDIKPQLEKLVEKEQLKEKVAFLGRIPHETIHEYTAQADLGFSLEENLGLNYFYSLPNKLFDFIAAGVPLLVSPFPEMESIVKHYQVGKIITEATIPENLAKIISEIFSDGSEYKLWKQNTLTATTELCWEEEEKKLISLFTASGLVPKHND